MSQPVPFRIVPLDAELTARARSDAGSIEADIAAMLRDPGIELVNIRHAEAGCSIARVDRG